MSCGGSAWTTKLSHEPRALSEPAPTRPLFRPTASPLSIRAANVCVKACWPLAVTVTVVPLTATSRLYHVSALTDPSTGDCAIDVPAARVALAHDELVQRDVDAGELEVRRREVVEDDVGVGLPAAERLLRADVAPRSRSRAACTRRGRRPPRRPGRASRRPPAACRRRPSTSRESTAKDSCVPLLNVAPRSVSRLPPGMLPGCGSVGGPACSCQYWWSCWMIRPISPSNSPLRPGRVTLRARVEVARRVGAVGRPTARRGTRAAAARPGG